MLTLVSAILFKPSIRSLKYHIRRENSHPNVRLKHNYSPCCGFRKCYRYSIPFHGCEPRSLRSPCHPRFYKLQPSGSDGNNMYRYHCQHRLPRPQCGRACRLWAGSISTCPESPAQTTGASGAVIFMLNVATSRATINVSKGLLEGCVRAARAVCPTRAFTCGRCVKRECGIRLSCSVHGVCEGMNDSEVEESQVLNTNIVTEKTGLPRPKRVAAIKHRAVSFTTNF